MKYDEIKEKYFKKDTDKSVPPSFITHNQFNALMARLDTLESKLELLIGKVLHRSTTGTNLKTFR